MWLPLKTSPWIEELDDEVIENVEVVRLDWPPDDFLPFTTLVTAL